jgi:hypothetical protein
MFCLLEDIGHHIEKVQRGVLINPFLFQPIKYRNLCAEQFGQQIERHLRIKEAECPQYGAQEKKAQVKESVQQVFSHSFWWRDCTP